MDKLEDHLTARPIDSLHFAPEPSVAKTLVRLSNTYKTADRYRRDVDLRADIANLPIENESIDLFYASHVLEHVPNDTDAIREIYRVLRPGGIAVLPVPIYSTGNQSRTATEEYNQARPDEDGHVRAPGLDYFNRYRDVFDEVNVYSSNDFDEKGDLCQLYIIPLETETEVQFRLPDFPVCIKA